VETPQEAVEKADLVVTDVWSSMGHEGEQDSRLSVFNGYQITADLLDLASRDTLLMHCLPAHRGEEISEDLLDDPRSVVFEEAGNRLHSQKALLEFVINGGW
jgi:ornithine carbamoyltransferase